MKKSNSIIGLNERDIMTRLKIINSFQCNEDVFFKKYFCDRDTLFNICLPAFKKLFREKTDIKFISLYLSNLKKFITLIKSINEDSNINSNQNQNNKHNLDQKEKYLKLLKYVSENVLYEFFPSKRLVIRYGEAGNKFYIILNGLVSVLIPVKINLQLTFYEYCRYIATLLLYKEFELAKISLRENKHVYRIDLPDMKYIIRYLNNNKEENEETNISKNSDINIMFGIKSDKNINNTKLRDRMSKYFKEFKNEDKITEEDKIFETEYFQKIEKFMKICLSREQQKIYEEAKKEKYQIEKDNGKVISAEEYINRLKSYKYNIGDIKDYFKERSTKKSHTSRRQIRSKTSKENEKENNIYYLNKNKNSVYLYEYQEIIQLETGSMFGDIALGDLISKRTATIISVSDCHFGCFNRDVYNHIKFSNDKKRRNMINYIGRTRIFKNLKYKAIEEKYINYFAFKNCVKDEYLLNIGEINNNIIIIKNGKFEINIKGGIQNIFEMINLYRDNFSELKEYGISDTLIRKINKLNIFKIKIDRLFGPKSIKTLDDNIYKLFVMNNSSIFGFKESEKQEKNDFISFFEIKCLSSEGEYILLDKRIFYRQMYITDFKVREDTRLYIKEFIDKTVNRLINILYSKIYYVLSKNELLFLKFMKIISNIQEGKEKDENRLSIKNLISEINLDYEYMNKYDLTHIECIIDKILDKFNVEDFHNDIFNLHMSNENEKIDSLKTRNIIKLGEEKYNTTKCNSLFKELRDKHKRISIKISNFKKNSNLQLNNICNFQNKKRLSKSDKIQNLFNYIIDKKYNNRNYSKVSIKSRKSISFSEEKKTNSINEIKNKNKRRFNFFLNKNNISYNANDISKSASFYILGKTNDLYMSDVNIDCNYFNYGNACISKLNFNCKNNSLSDFGTSRSNNRTNYIKNKYIELKMNQIFGSEEKYKSDLDRCFSAKHSNLSSINIFDSNKMSRETYSERRKKYLLKSVRDIWTRNRPIVLYKRKYKSDKNV